MSGTLGCSTPVQPSPSPSLGLTASRTQALAGRTEQQRGDVIADAVSRFIACSEEKRNSEDISTLTEDIRKLRESLISGIDLVRQALDAQGEVSANAVKDIRAQVDQIKTAHEQRQQQLSQSISNLQQDGQTVAATNIETAARVNALPNNISNDLNDLKDSFHKLDQKLERDRQRITDRIEEHFEIIKKLEERMSRAEKSHIIDHDTTKGSISEQLRTLEEGLQQGMVMLETRVSRSEETTRTITEALGSVIELMERKDDILAILNSPKKQADVQESAYDSSSSDRSAKGPPTAQTARQVGDNQQPDQNGGQGEDTGTRLLGFAQYAKKMHRLHKTHRPKSDTRFIWTFINGIEDSEIRHRVQDRLVEEYPTKAYRINLQPRRTKSAQRISIRKELKWSDVVLALNKGRILPSRKS